MSGRKTSNSSGPRATARPVAASQSSGFWKTKTLEEMAAEQGVESVAHDQALAAPPGSLWRDDNEFEDFLAWLAARRKERG